MEPFNFSLNQVNIEEKDITAGDSLNAFSDVYCYESDFQTESSWFPVRGKQVKKKGKGGSTDGLIDLIHESNTEYYTHGSGRAGSHDYRLPRALIDSESKDSSENVASTTASPTKTSIEQSRSASGSLRAFTETVDALALQTSVLGKKDVLTKQQYDNLAEQPAVQDETTLALMRSLAELNKYRETKEQITSKMGAADVALATTQSQSPVHLKHDVRHSSAEEERLMTASPMLRAAFSKSTENSPTLLTPKASTDNIEALSPEAQNGMESNQAPNVDQIKGQKSLEETVDQSENQKSVDETVKTGNKLSGKDKEVKKKGMKQNGSAKGRTSKAGKAQELIPIPKGKITTTVERSVAPWLRRAACSSKHAQNHPMGEPVTSADAVDDNDEEPDEENNEVENEEAAQVHSAGHTVRHEKERTESSSPKIGIEPENVNPPSQVALFSEETIIATESSTGELSHQIALHLKNESGENILTSVDSNQSNVPTEETPNAQKKGSVENETIPASPTEISSESGSQSTKENRVPETSQSQTKLMTSADPVSAFGNATFVDTAMYHAIPQFDGDYASLKRQLDVLMRARAKLEGQLEVMEIESNASLQQRTQLQSQVGTLQQQLNAQEATVTKATEERDALLSDVRTMKEMRSSLEQVIIDAQKLLEDKETENKTAKEDLRLSRESNEKLQEGLKQVKRELQAKNSTAEDLKNKIAELYVQYETANQTRLLQVQEIESVKAELKSVGVAKEWYQQQLHESQQAKTQLQREITTVKSEVIGKTTVMERLKADNVRLQQMLADTQQRIIQEKQLLAGQLEAIEADMLEREAAFAQIQRERDALHARLQGAPGAPVNESDALQSKEADLNKDLQTSRLQNDVRRKTAQIAVLEHEQAELMKRLTLSQESILERDKNLEVLEQRYIDVEVALRKLQQEVTSKDEEMTRHKQEKDMLEMEVRSVRDEKQSFDSVIQNLKGDMTKVESSFQRIKQELARKTDELNSMKQEKEKTNEELAAKQKQIQSEEIAREVERNVTNVAPDKLSKDEHSQALPTDADIVNAALLESEARLKQLTEENIIMQQQLEKLQLAKDAEVQKLSGEKLQLEQNLAKVSSGDETDSKQNDTDKKAIDDFQSEKHVLLQKIAEFEHESAKTAERVKDLETENIKLVQEMNSKPISENETEVTKENEVLVEKIAELNQNLSSAGKTSDFKDEQLANLQEENQRLSQEISFLQQKVVSLPNSMKVDELEAEKTNLEQKIASLTAQLEVKSDVAAISSQQAQPDVTQIVAKTVKEIYSNIHTIMIAEHTVSHNVKKEDLVKIYSSEERVDTDFLIDENCRLKLAVLTQAKSLAGGQQDDEERQKLEKAVINARDLISSSQETEEALKQEVESLRVFCERLQKQNEEYQTSTSREKQELLVHIEDISTQLELAQRTTSHKQDDDAMLTLTLELEKEKGKLAAVIQQYTQMKEHALDLEAQLAAQKSKRVEQSLHVQQESADQQRTLDEIQAECTALKLALNKQTNALKETKKQLLTEKGNHVKTRRKYETLFVDHDQMRIDYEKKIKEVEELSSGLEKARARETAYRTDQEKLSQELQSANVRMAQLEQEVSKQKDKDPVLADTIQNLQWQLREKEQEFQATREQAQMAENRQTLELSNIHKTMQANHAELTRLREDLMQTKRAKTALQARVVELRSALQSTIDSNKGSTSTKLDLTAIENLLKETHSPASQSKPLSFIQATLSELRGEITTLQSHMDEHTSALHDSTLAWKQLEQQVADLREVCKTTAAERENTSGSIPPPLSTANIPQFTLPSSLQFSLPNMEMLVGLSGNSSVKQNESSENNNSVEISPEMDVKDENPIDTLVQSTSSSQSSSPERRINTKAMELNSIYAPKR